MLSFFPRGVLDEILNLIESVSEVFSSCSLIFRISLIEVYLCFLHKDFPIFYPAKFCLSLPSLFRSLSRSDSILVLFRRLFQLFHSCFAVFSPA